ncbi:MAG TPA: hypothetical protein VEL11_17940 [Candidatus Bathyarchaeia archaeon]|nr:hypothetical protein [Candidatus Bathyarchaeia archaeon]
MEGGFIIANLYSIVAGFNKLVTRAENISIAYNRAIHRYQVFPSRDISVSINENPRSKDNFNTIRLLEIPTSSDDLTEFLLTE